MMLLKLSRETISYADEVLRNTVHALNQYRAYFPFVNVFFCTGPLKSQSMVKKRNHVNGKCSSRERSRDCMLVWRICRVIRSGLCLCWLQVDSERIVFVRLQSTSTCWWLVLIVDDIIIIMVIILLLLLLWPISIFCNLYISLLESLSTRERRRIATWRPINDRFPSGNRRYVRYGIRNGSKSKSIRSSDCSCCGSVSFG